jgi:hypothetical protein
MTCDCTRFFNQKKCIFDKEKNVKQLVKVEEVEAEGLIGLMGQVVTLFCGVYIYTGKLVGVNDSFVKLDQPKIVYETGEFTTKTWKDAQALPNSWYVQTAAIESFGICK